MIAVHDSLDFLFEDARFEPALFTQSQTVVRATSLDAAYEAQATLVASMIPSSIHMGRDGASYFVLVHH